MRKTLIILTTLLSLFLVSCSTNSTSSKAVEEGKIALVSKEYDKAKDLFTLAINEDSKNTDASSLLDLTTNYIDLLSIIDSSEFDKANDLISKIESNDKLDIIKDSFNDTKNNLNSKKEIFDKYITEVESIETLFTENKIDDAKSQAIAKLEEVKGIKPLEDRLNTVITNVDEKIAIAQTEILKYATDVDGIEYKQMKTFDSNSGVFAEVAELKGKTMYHFYEQTDYSPREYVYDENTNDVFLLQQGQVFWMNNGNIHLNKEEEKASSINKISREEAKKLVTNYLLSNYPEYKSNFDDIFGIAEAYDYLLEEYNVYGVPVMDKTNPNFKTSDYFVDATTGEVRLNLTY